MTQFKAIDTPITHRIGRVLTEPKERFKVFDAYAKNLNILRVIVKYHKDGRLNYVDILCEENK